MSRRDDGDEADIGPGYGGEIGDVTWFSGTHFQHRVLGIVGHGQQGQWQADLVVVVAGIDMSTTVARQNRGNQGLHRGLAIGAGDPDDPCRVLGAHCAGQVPQCERGIIDHDLCQRTVDLACHQRSHRAACCGVGQILMTVHAFALDRHKQLSGFQLAGVDGHAPGLGVVAKQAPVGPQRDGAQPHHPRTSGAIRPSAARATARSSNGCFPRPSSW